MSSISTKNILEFSLAVRTEFQGKQHPSTKYEKDSLNCRIGAIAEKAMSTYRGYKEEKSLKARIEAYTELSSALQAVADHVKASKTIWEYLLSFFCYSSREESDLYSILHQIQEENIKTKVDHINAWLPDSYKLDKFDPIGWWIYEWMGAENLRRCGLDPEQTIFKPRVNAFKSYFKDYLKKYTQ